MRRTHRGRTRLGLTWSFCVVLLQALIARVGISDDKTAEALQHFNAGKALYTAEDYQNAAVEFEVSIQLHPTQNGYYNLVNCLKALHRYGQALRMLDEMTTRFDDSMTPIMRDKTAALRETLRLLVGEIVLTVRPDGARIVLDGAEIGTSPLDTPLVIAPGTHTIDVRKAGYDTVSKTFELLSKEHKVLAVTLAVSLARLDIKVDVPGAEIAVNGKPVGQAPLSEALALAPATYSIVVTKRDYVERTREIILGPGEARVVEMSLEKRPPPVPTGQDALAKKERDERQKITRWLTRGGLAGALALGAVSGIAYAVAAKQAADFRAYKKDFENQPNNRTDILDKQKDSKRKNEAYAKVGLGFGIAALTVAAATGVFWGWTAFGKTHRETDVAVSPGSITVRF